jgi:hypothetical protein
MLALLHAYKEACLRLCANKQVYVSLRACKYASEFSHNTAKVHNGFELLCIALIIYLGLSFSITNV